MKPKIHRAFRLRFDRTLSHDSLRQVYILIGVLVTAFILSFFLLSWFGGDWQKYCEANHISKWIFPLYLLIDGNAFNSFYADANVSSGAVFVACLIYVTGVIIFTGMIISVMTNMIERRVDDHRDGLIHYLKAGHYIIMGYDEMVPSFIRHIFNKDKDAFVLVLTSAKVPYIKEKIRKSFSETQMKQIIVNYGHRTSSDFYKDICLEAAEQVYIVGYRSMAAHDAVNVECVNSIYNYLSRPNIKDRPKRITCVFKDLDTYASFKTSEIFSKITALDIEFVPFNFFAGWAKQVFVKRCYRDIENLDVKYPYPAVYGDGIDENDKKFVHLVFVGTTNFAVAFAMEAANVLHFPNFNHDHRLKTKITFIDINADKEKDEFITRNRHFFEVQSYTYLDLSDEIGYDETKQNKKDNEKSGYMPPIYFNKDNGYEQGVDYDFLDVEFEFVRGNIFSQKVQNEISKWALAKDEQYLSIFLAQSDQRLNFVMGMNMPDSVYENEISVFIRQDRSDDFVTNLRLVDQTKSHEYSFVKDGQLMTKNRKGRYAHIYPFGMNETGYCEDDHSLKRAKLINYLYNTANYETYKFQDIPALDAMSDDVIWEDANKYWKELSVALKWSSLYNAYTIRTKLATLRAMRHLKLDDQSKDTAMLTDLEVEELAKVEHNRWNVEKLLMGYRKSRKEEDKYEYDEFANKLKNNKKLYIHHDIRPYDKLDIIAELDKEFSRYIPWILKMTENK